MYVTIYPYIYAHTYIHACMQMYISIHVNAEIRGWGKCDYLHELVFIYHIGMTKSDVGLPVEIRFLLQKEHLYDISP